MIIDEADYLAHYGILRKSGRYPWGSGGNEVSVGHFLGEVDQMHKSGMTEAEIARVFKISTTTLRARKSIAKNEQKQEDIATAWKLHEKGMSNVAIGAQMGKPESSVRALLVPGLKDKTDQIQSIATMLKEQVEQKKYIDVGSNVHLLQGYPEAAFNNAVAVCVEDGYKKHYTQVQQLGTGKFTSLKVLTKGDVTGKELWANRDQIQQITSFTEDGGRSSFGILPPIKIDPKRVGVIYKEQGGDKADGVIYVREGVPDVALGKSRYAQVRIAVGDGHYLKGMAMYKTGLPEGIDLQFNTNKSDTGNHLDAMKAVKDDPNNPFGAVVRQIVQRKDGSEFVTGYGRNFFDGTEKVTSAMNLVHEQGAWGEWSDTLSSQMLSKQRPHLAKTQLDMTFEQKQTEFERIKALTNPTVRKHLLEKLADDADSSAVHLKASALKDQATHVILPISTMPPHQVYAPNYLDGTPVVLVRFPHGGTFEIPELVVNNNHPEAKRLLGGAPDAIGIHHTVAERLSGADFDGDTVLVIPNNGPKKIKTTPALEQLKGFDPRAGYKLPDDAPKMTSKQKGQQMGQISNLITDMTIKGASTAELARAIKHSMVVIDAEKHHLDYKKSAVDNGIAALKAKYQGKNDNGSQRGASTIISRASAELRVPDLKTRSAKDGGPIDRTTGAIVYDPATKQTYINRKGVEVVKTRNSEKLAETNNAFDLIDGVGFPIERLYAEHSNRLKSLANEIRLEAVNTPRLQRSPSAAKVYAKEVDRLTEALRLAERNAPLERQAQIYGNATLRMVKANKPDMDKETEKKVKAQALQEGRNRTGAGKTRIEVSRQEWDAIQAGAISNDKLSKILDNADMDIIRQYATPKKQPKMTPSMTTRAQAMLNSGATRAEVAQQLGVSLTTLDLVTSAEGK